MWRRLPSAPQGRVDGDSQHYESPEIVDYEDFAELTQHQGAWRSI
jgi:hypothetical protein